MSGRVKVSNRAVSRSTVALVQVAELPGPMSPTCTEKTGVLALMLSIMRTYFVIAELEYGTSPKTAMSYGALVPAGLTVMDTVAEAVPPRPSLME